MGGSGDSEPGIPVEPDHKGWFDGVSNYRDTKDRRNADAVTVEVGVEANSGYLGFGPAAVAVTPNTTVTWSGPAGVATTTSSPRRTCSTAGKRSTTETPPSGTPSTSRACSGIL